MKGLLLKDFKLLKNQRLFMLMMIFIAVVFMFTMDGWTSFANGYISMVGSMLVVSTMSYDDYYNGMAFLMTLSIERKDYVKEKYILGLLIAIMSWTVGYALSIIGILIKDMPVSLLDHTLSSALILGVVFLYLAILIPVNLKWGQTRGSIGSIIVFGASLMIGFGVVQLCHFLDFDILAYLNSLNEWSILQVMVIVVMIIQLLSYFISYQIMSKKEF